MRHYTAKDSSVVADDIRNFGVAHWRGRVIECVVRAGRKEGESALEAIAKAAHYAELNLRPRLLMRTPEQMGDAFELSSEQCAVIYQAVYGGAGDVLAALRDLKRVAEVEEAQAVASEHLLDDAAPTPSQGKNENPPTAPHGGVFGHHHDPDAA